MFEISQERGVLSQGDELADNYQHTPFDNESRLRIINRCIQHEALYFEHQDISHFWSTVASGLTFEVDGTSMVDIKNVVEGICIDRKECLLSGKIPRRNETSETLESAIDHWLEIEGRKLFHYCFEGLMRANIMAFGPEEATEADLFTDHCHQRAISNKTYMESRGKGGRIQGQNLLYAFEKYQARQEKSPPHFHGPLDRNQASSTFTTPSRVTKHAVRTQPSPEASCSKEGSIPVSERGAFQHSGSYPRDMSQGLASRMHPDMTRTTKLTPRMSTLPVSPILSDIFEFRGSPEPESFSQASIRHLNHASACSLPRQKPQHLTTPSRISKSTQGTGRINERQEHIRPKARDRILGSERGSVSSRRQECGNAGNVMQENLADLITSSVSRCIEDFETRVNPRIDFIEERVCRLFNRMA
ncbi:hypothetical protein F5Y18DRAFT_400685 [Xylariaceae sp. FL1019]|nr:hypothetical protein F5Y18DRAFT_400685 [Xylariaceae sp. FL1019]